MHAFCEALNVWSDCGEKMNVARKYNLGSVFRLLKIGDKIKGRVC